MSRARAGFSSAFRHICSSTDFSTLAMALASAGHRGIFDLSPRETFIAPLDIPAQWQFPVKNQPRRRVESLFSAEVRCHLDGVSFRPNLMSSIFRWYHRYRKKFNKHGYATSLRVDLNEAKSCLAQNGNGSSCHSSLS